MEKIYLWTAVSLLFVTGGHSHAASWNPDPMENMQISGEEAIGQDLPLSASNGDGDCYISWLSWENGKAYLKLQLVDENGETKWEDGGIYISKNDTPTWSSGYDMTCDAEGNAIIVYPDNRNGAWQAYAYKVGKNGDMLWGDGILLPVDKNETSLNPKVIVTPAGNTVFAFQALLGSRNSIKVSKLDAYGKKMWGGLIEITGTNGLYNLIAGDDDYFFLSYIEANKGNMSVMRYTSNGEPAWAMPTVVDEGGALISSEPHASPDSNGGILLSWYHSVTNMLNVGNLQAVRPDGTTLWDNAIESQGIAIPSSDSNGNLYAAEAYSMENGSNLTLTKYNHTGELEWESDPLLDYSYSVSVYGLRSFGDDIIVVYRNASDYNIADIDYAHFNANSCIPIASGIVSGMEGDKGRGSLSVTSPTQAVVTWGDNGSSKGGGKIYAQNIVITPSADISAVHREAIKPLYNGSEIIGCHGESASLFDMTGKLVRQGRCDNGIFSTGSLRSGLYLLCCDGKATKLLIK